MPELSLRMSLAAAAIMIATSGIAEAQAVTKYDGTYNGVSNTTNGGGRSCLPTIPVPRPLTIRNGTVQWGVRTPFQGDVTADGWVHARGSNGVTYVGKIDGSGKITLGSSAPGPRAGWD
jgi:hypothetical protein